MFMSFLQIETPKWHQSCLISASDLQAHNHCFCTMGLLYKVRLLDSAHSKAGTSLSYQYLKKTRGYAAAHHGAPPPTDVPLAGYRLKTSACNICTQTLLRSPGTWSSLEQQVGKIFGGINQTAAMKRGP